MGERLFASPIFFSAVTSAQADNCGGKRVGSPNRKRGRIGEPIRVPPHCFRLAPLAENVTAQRSVTHLTISNTCSAPLFSSCSARRKRNRPAVSYPPYDLQDVFRPTVFGLLRSPKT
ncbi:MAG: hypothetical protein LBQ66_13035 [Planctomycetaceae bacterium]|nr:hypothetical protein [Planctomycetaceae bacterium]